MAKNLKEMSALKERLTGGHRLCAGCGASVIVRNVLRAIGDDKEVVVGCATGCLEVSTSVYPFSAWRASFIHSAFENAAATVSGVEAAYKAMKRRGKVEKDFKFVTFGGDGGTYDIGFQSLSGAMERGHNMVYVCYDNGAYMNTGIQRSSATPKYADTTTSPAGTVVPGKQQFRKDLTAVMAAHNIPYVAQAAPSAWKDLHEKSRKAFDVEGPAFLNVLSVCPRGWRSETEDGMEITQLAVETCWWPLFEVVNGEWKLSYKPKKKKPVAEFLELQGRFKHMFKKGNEHMIQEVQDNVDASWKRLLKMCGETE